ncbi:putative autophagy-related protein 11 isoform X1 [Anthonomus grandis grandis]|uniref:putative autophagy-related protein 11 isoform X1 n=1 Tax=Anthonomus grandis grandis TaxID=2921223 RepID=UPI0021659BEB|nr:putative autophagy-related protein 11 isoform X1 [Anthonomus grandis grandis]XP_050295722.1 putative autophagy-related protein 11 isoform X1 [Anthonomus grandis grandis]XP_050295723.1 putative autophagy-related protein 11 isoform X1 [Anthonomus grandis grandis]
MESLINQALSNVVTDDKCSLCDVMMSNESAKFSHCTSQRHLNKINEYRLKVKRNLETLQAVQVPKVIVSPLMPFFKCSICNISHTSEEKLARHWSVNHCRIYPFYCPTCKIPKDSPESMFNHFKTQEHQAKSEGQWAIPFDTTLPRELNNLMLITGCNVCNKKFTEPLLDNALQHYKTQVHQSAVYRWSVRSTTSSLQSLDGSDDLQTSVFCYICEKNFLKSERNIHVKSFPHFELELIKQSLVKKGIILNFWSHYENGFLCKLCDAKITGYSQYEGHFNSVYHKHRLEEWIVSNTVTSFKFQPSFIERSKWFYCHICNKSLDGTFNALGHYTGTVHLGLASKYCNICGFNAISELSLASHKKEKHYKQSAVLKSTTFTSPRPANGNQTSSSNSVTSKPSVISSLAIKNLPLLNNPSCSKDNVETLSEQSNLESDNKNKNLKEQVFNQLQKLVQKLYYSKTVPYEYGLEYLKKINKEVDQLSKKIAATTQCSESETTASDVAYNKEADIAIHSAECSQNAFTPIENDRTELTNNCPKDVNVPTEQILALPLVTKVESNSEFPTVINKPALKESIELDSDESETLLEYTNSKKKTKKAETISDLLEDILERKYEVQAENHNVATIENNVLNEIEILLRKIDHDDVPLHAALQCLEKYNLELEKKDFIQNDQIVPFEKQNDVSLDIGLERSNETGKSGLVKYIIVEPKYAKENEQNDKKVLLKIEGNKQEESLTCLLEEEQNSTFLGTGLNGRSEDFTLIKDVNDELTNFLTNEDRIKEASIEIKSNNEQEIQISSSSDCSLVVQQQNGTSIITGLEGTNNGSSLLEENGELKNVLKHEDRVEEVSLIIENNNQQDLQTISLLQEEKNGTAVSTNLEITHDDSILIKNKNDELKNFQEYKDIVEEVSIEIESNNQQENETTSLVYYLLEQEQTGTPIATHLKGTNDDSHLVKDNNDGLKSLLKNEDIIEESSLKIDSNNQLEIQTICFDGTVLKQEQSSASVVTNEDSSLNKDRNDEPKNFTKNGHSVEEVPLEIETNNQQKIQNALMDCSFSQQLPNGTSTVTDLNGRINDSNLFETHNDKLKNFTETADSVEEVPVVIESKNQQETQTTSSDCSLLEEEQSGVSIAFGLERTSGVSSVPGKNNDEHSKNKVLLQEVTSLDCSLLEQEKTDTSIAIGLEGTDDESNLLEDKDELKMVSKTKDNVEEVPTEIESNNQQEIQIASLDCFLVQEENGTSIMPSLEGINNDSSLLEENSDQLKNEDKVEKEPLVIGTNNQQEIHTVSVVQQKQNGTSVGTSLEVTNEGSTLIRNKNDELINFPTYEDSIEEVSLKIESNNQQASQTALLDCSHLEQEQSGSSIATDLKGTNDDSSVVKDNDDGLKNLLKNKDIIEETSLKMYSNDLQETRTISFDSTLLEQEQSGTSIAIGLERTNVESNLLKDKNDEMVSTTKGNVKEVPLEIEGTNQQEIQSTSLDHSLLGRLKRNLRF